MGMCGCPEQVPHHEWLRAERARLWREQHDAGYNTRVDRMRPGQRFVDSMGDVWTYLRRDHALSGAHHARRDPRGLEPPDSPGLKSCFAGCADGVLECPLCGALEGVTTDHDVRDGLLRCAACLAH